MSRPLLPPERIGGVSGFGKGPGTLAEGYIFLPKNISEARDVFLLAKSSGRQVVLRGAGMSYGDAAIATEQLILNDTKMSGILSWDPTTGILEAEGGVTLDALWKHVIADGYWLPVVSGTAYPTLGGALAMNIHGKNHFLYGTLGEHVMELEVLFPSGETRLIKKEDELFSMLIGSAGLLGMITRAKLQMKKISSGDLQVRPLSCACWAEQFEAFEVAKQESADYAVGWVDCFAKGSSAGRGVVHLAWYAKDADPSGHTFSLEHQQLPQKIFGVLPVEHLEPLLKLANRRAGVRFLNQIKYQSSRLLGHKKEYEQALAKFNFLLDSVPNWQNSYLPGGLIQLQPFLPKEHASKVFSQLIKLQQEAKLESFLGVLKRHRPTPFLFDYCLDGYSLALDFKITQRNWGDTQCLIRQMIDTVLDHGGKFYFAKDSVLEPKDLLRFLPAEKLCSFKEHKRKLDPDGLLTSQLAKRLALV